MSVIGAWAASGGFSGFGPPPYQIQLINDSHRDVEIRVPLDSDPQRFRGGDALTFDGYLFNARAALVVGGEELRFDHPLPLRHDLAVVTRSPRGPLYRLLLGPDLALRIAGTSGIISAAGFPIYPDKQTAAPQGTSAQPSR
jgi:hypothetical protein